MATQNNSSAGKLAENSEAILRMYANGDSVADIQRALAKAGTVVGHPALSRWIKRRLAVKSERALALNPVLLEATKLLATASNLAAASQSATRTPPSSKSTHAQVAPASSNQPEGSTSDTTTASKPKYEIGDTKSRKGSLDAETTSALRESSYASAVPRRNKANPV